MILREGLRAAWMGITGNILRSALTTLGIIIGVAAVITLIGVGQGAQADITQEINRLGTNSILIASRGEYRFSSEDADEIANRVPTVQRAAPVLTTTLALRWGTETHRANAEGAGGSYADIIGLEVEQGRLFDEDDVKNRGRVAVIGSTVADELFAGRSPMGESIHIQGQSFTVIGIMRPQGAAMGQDRDNLIMVPITTLQRTLRTDRISMIYAQGTSSEDIDLATSHIERIFEVLTGRDDSIAVTSQSQILEIVDAITGTLTVMLGAIASISLVVGGIGIMNIMLVSVKERTREIGIRKAVGARRRDILLQFLIESIALSLGGGFLGILSGWGLTALIRFFGLTAIITPSSVLLACGFSAAVGLASGVYPAMQAARLDPIQSLRYE